MIFRYRFFLTTLAMAILMVINGNLLAKSFSIERIEIQAVIQPDGSMQINESRTYNFRGNFSWADYRLPLTGIGSILNFTLGDEQQEFTESTSEQPGTYTRQQNDQDFYVRWFYRANNERKTFTLGYLATDVIKRYKDVAELYFKFVGSANRVRIGKVSVTIQLPENAYYPEVRAWAHGPLWGDVLFREGNVVLLVSPLPAGQFWEARVIFPSQWVAEETEIINEVRLQTILQEENAWARQANEERQRALELLEKKREKESEAWNYAIILCLIGILVFVVIYLRYGKGFSVPYHENISSELPADEPPAITSIIFFNKQVYGSAMTATIFDLARRGYLSIDQTSLPEKKWWGTRPAHFALVKTSPKQSGKPLLDYESNLLEFIFDDLGQGNARMDFKTLSKNRSKMQSWFRKWKDLVKAHVDDVPYYEKSSKRGTLYSVILSLLVIAGGILILLFLGTPGILAIVCGSILFGLSFTVLKYTRDIKLRRLKLSALKKYLKKYYFLQDSGQNQWRQNIDSYLIYGMALGLGKRDIEKIIGTVPENQQQAYFPWYHYPAGAYASPAEFATAVSTMVSVASSTVSSSTGAGGGASGGGGGGGGGAAGGAG
jgi:uncharacterized membrane protein